MKELTSAQTKVLDFLKAYIDEHQYAPSISEIGKGIGLSSTASVYYHLNNLEKHGFIRIAHGKMRGIQLVNSSAEAKRYERLRLSIKVTERDENGVFLTLFIGGNRYVLDNSVR